MVTSTLLIGGNAPVGQGSDNQAAGVAQVLVAVLEARVGLSDDAVVLLLYDRREDDGQRQRLLL